MLDMLCSGGALNVAFLRFLWKFSGHSTDFIYFLSHRRVFGCILSNLGEFVLLFAVEARQAR